LDVASQLEVSVIIPARNEEANIARVVRSLASQSCIREIVVVDDQSTDKTPQILLALKDETPLLRILSLHSLPEGWLGKTHAVTQGAAIATGDWLLFTDADTVHLPGSLDALLRRADDAHVDLLSLSPGQETPTWWEKAVIPLVFVTLSTLFRFEDVSDPKSPVAAANGQYLLVRRSVYEACGGHEAVKSSILEDVELARRIKRSGGKLLFLPGSSWVRTRMYRTFREMWQGWTKNLYLLYAGDRSRMISRVAGLKILDVVPVLALACILAAFVTAHVPWPSMMLACGLLMVLAARQWNYRKALSRIGFEPGLAVYLPVGAALLSALMLESLRAYSSTGSVQWKGRQYSTKGQK
jgi:glycosyltransferase involved in cell wall biosynthesis